MLRLQAVLFLLRGCEAQVHEAGGCHPGPARCLPDRGGGSPWQGLALAPLQGLRSLRPGPQLRPQAAPEASAVLWLACFGSWPVSFLSGVSRPRGLDCA